MADTEIQILIRAVDEATATLQRIEGAVGQTNKLIQKQTEKTSDAFTEQTANLLVLGQAAATVDNIFTSYSNMQIRVENATERLMNAQDRLRKAQYNLNKVMKDAKSKAEDIADAEADVESASRGLTISQNNLERANNRVVDTYISIGIQTMTLIAQGPKLIAVIKSMTAFLGPYGLAIAGVTTLIGGITLAIKDNKEKIEEQQAAYKAEVATAWKKNLEETTKLQEMQNNRLQRYNDLLTQTQNKLYELINGPIEGEKELQLDLAKQRQKVAWTQVSLAQATTDSEREKIQARLDEEERSLNVLETTYNAEYDAFRAVQIAEVNLAADMKLRTQGIYASTFSDIVIQVEQFKNDFTSITETLMNEETAQAAAVENAWRNAMNVANRAQSEATFQQSMQQGTAPQGMGGHGTIVGAVPASGSNQPRITAPKDTSTSTSWLGNIVNTVKGWLGFGDFISRPGQEPVRFSSDDTIVGMKNPGKMGGITINIDSIYGISERQISQALYDRFKESINT